MQSAPGNGGSLEFFVLVGWFSYRLGSSSKLDGPTRIEPMKETENVIQETFERATFTEESVSVRLKQ